MDQDLFEIEERFVRRQLRVWFAQQQQNRDGASRGPALGLARPFEPIDTRDVRSGADRKDVPPLGTEAWVDPVLLDILEAEAEIQLSTYASWLDSYESTSRFVSEDFLRAIHTLNGAFAMADVPEITDVTGAAEQLIKRLWAAELIPSDDVVEELRKVKLAIQLTLWALRETPQIVRGFRSLADKLTEFQQDLPAVQTSLVSDDSSRSSVASGSVTYFDHQVEYAAHDPSAYAESRYGRESRAEGPPPWLIGFSKQFKKDTSGLDRKLMGRILEVLEEVADFAPPFAPRGDTFKPLTGELAGCWRYRLGDHRLVLQPLAARSQINVLTFAARGSVYE